VDAPRGGSRLLTGAATATAPVGVDCLSGRSGGLRQWKFMQRRLRGTSIANPLARSTSVAIAMALRLPIDLRHGGGVSDLAEPARAVLVSGPAS